MSDPSASYRKIARQCRALSEAASNPEVVAQLQQWAVECDRQADRALHQSRRNDRLEQAHRHRLRAEEYRVVAEQIRNPTARATYRHLAETYEAMARQLESRAERDGLDRTQQSKA